MTRRWRQPARQLPRRPKRNWTDSVVLVSYAGSINEPDSELGLRPPRPADEPPPPVSRPVPRWLVAAAAVLAGCAMVAALLWWQHRSRVIYTTTQAPISYLGAGPDAAGCPISSRCELQFDVLHPIGAAARRLFPYAAVLSSMSLTDADTGRTVLTTIVLSEPSGIDISATAQCIPSSGPVPDRTAALPAYGPAQADLVVAGKPGCSVAVSAQIPRSLPVPVSALRQLAEDPAVQLVP